MKSEKKIEKGEREKIEKSEQNITEKVEVWFMFWTVELTLQP